MSGPSPAFDQDAFAGRCDTGNETSVTWKFADGTCNDTAANATNRDWTQAVDENFRVRFVVQETAGGSQSNFKEDLQYNRNSVGWNDVDDSSSLVVRMSLSTQFAHGDDTTQQVGSGTFLSTNSGMNETNPPGSTMVPDYTANTETEFEFCVQIRGVDVNDTDTIELRVTDNGTDFAAYTNTPTITVDKPSGVNQPVIPFSMGQWIGDKTEEWEPKSQYIYFPFRGGIPAAAANPVIPYTIGQWVGDKDLEIDASPQYTYFPFVSVAPPAPSNPVIPYVMGQWLGDKDPEWEPKPQYVYFPFQLPANPVIQYTIGQWVGDKDPEWEPPSQYTYFPFRGGVVPPATANPVIPYYKGQWIGDKVVPIYVEPKYHPTIVFQLPLPANPVIPFYKGQWIGDDVIPIYVEPRYYPTVIFRQVAAFNPVIPYYKSPVEWWNDPIKQSSAWDPSEAPFYYPLIIYHTTYNIYGTPILQIDPSTYTGESIFLEAVMRATSGTARIRLFNITDGVEEAVIQTTSTSFVRVRSAAITLPASTKEYRVEAGFSPSSTTTVEGARVIVST